MSPSGRSGNTSNSSEGKTCHVRNRRTSRQNPGTARAARPTHGPDDDRDDGTRPGLGRTGGLRAAAASATGRGRHASVAFEADPEIIGNWIKGYQPLLKLFCVGKSIDVYKD